MRPSRRRRNPCGRVVTHPQRCLAPLRDWAPPPLLDDRRMNGRIVTEGLVLEPLSRQTAQAVLAGLPDGLRRGEGWPHADTLDALGMAAKHGSEKHDSEEDGSEARGPEAWLILEHGLVVGDAGTYGPPDAAGDVEIGYGLAEPARGKGLASEFVPALAQALLARPEVRRVVAREV